MQQGRHLISWALQSCALRPWQPVLNKSHCRMVVCDTSNLIVLDCMLTGLNHLSYVHAMADGAERELTFFCCQTAPLRARRLRLSCVISTSGKLPAVTMA